MTKHSPLDQYLVTSLNDPDRLAVLHQLGLLDSTPEPAFDRLTHLATRILRVPVALVSLVEADRQFFKSCIGLPEPWASQRETPLSHSFCQHVVATGEPLIINDARTHPLVRDNLAIKDLGVIAYAGIPLILDDHHVLGSFCAIDTEPRQWTDDEISILRDLAATVLTEIRLRSDAIERRRIAEAAARLGKILDESVNEIYIFDSDTLQFVQVNQGAQQNLGYTMDELRRLTPLDLKPEFTRESFEAMIAPLRRGQTDFITFETVHRRKDGSLYPVEVRLQLSRTEDPPVFAAIILDTTARQAAEAALRQSEEKYRTLFETMAQGVVYHDTSGAITTGNPAAEQILGLTLDQMQGRTSIDPRWHAIHPDGSPFPGDEHPAMIALRTGREVRDEVMGVCNPEEDQYRWININATPQFRPGDDTPYQVYATFEDITARHQSEAALRESEARFRTMADSAPVLLWVSDTSGACTFFNQPWLRFTGRTMEQELGYGWTEHVHPDDLERCLHFYRANFDARRRFEMEYRLRRGDGEYRWMLDTGTPRFAPDGAFAGYIGSCIDINERKRAEERLKSLHEIATALSEAVTVEAVADVVIRRGSAAINAGGALIALLEDESWLRLISATGYPASLLESWQRMPLDAPVPIADAVRSGQPVWIDTPAAYVDRYPTLDELTEQSGSRSFAAVPLQVDGRAIGVLGLSFATPQTFGDTDATFLIALARQCAQALERARLYREAREAAREADESRALLDTLFATAPIGLAFFDHDLRLVRVNEALAAMNHRPVEEHIGCDVTEVASQTPASIAADLRHVLQSGAPIANKEIVGTTGVPPETQRHFLVNYYPVPGPNDTPLGVGVVVQDVTERTRAEAAQRFLAEASELLVSSLDYEQTLDNVARLVVPRLADWCAIDVLEDDTIKRIAVAHSDPARVALAEDLRRRYPPDPDAPFGVAAVIRSGRSELMPIIPDELLTRATPDEELLAILRGLGLRSSMAVPLIAGGRVLGAITFVAAESGRYFDAVDLQLAEDLARRAAIAVDNARLYQAAQEAILARDEFLSIASHELKTPLTSLQLQSQGLLRALTRSRGGVPAERIINKLQLIERQTQRLTQLSDNLLDVSRIRLGRIELRMETLDLVQLARDLAARFEEQLREARCAVRIVADAPVLLTTDRLRLEQIITNLLSNAIKYGPGKPIEIAVEQDDSHARLRIRDEGIGIAPDHLERIFVRFERAVSSRNYGGLGLGLYIVRQLVEALGGTIRVSSELGVGSAFTVTLPLAARRTREDAP